jgi:hypothetical protein
MTVSNVTINTFASTATGTDCIGVNLAKTALYPNANVSFYYTDYMALLVNSNQSTSPRYLYSESIGLIAARSMVIAVVYIAILLSVALFAFKRWQIAE